ncbi:MAG: hypothetical protein MN733_18140 [Nitrososphaera sp.]|nr:hypothetical protein [Nitrososphaera sp.]
MMQEKFWHFLREDRRLLWGSKEVVEVGKTLRVEGTPVLCSFGFHACRKAINALAYAPGPIACRVMLGGEIIEDTDKLVANERTVIWMGNATHILRDFARWCALEVIHLWNAPEVVRRYLETGKESLRDAARAAARAADAARDAFMNRANEKLTEMLESLHNS